MTQPAAVLQTCNNELVKCIEDLCNKRDALQRDILNEEEEKNKLQNDIRILSERFVVHLINQLLLLNNFSYFNCTGRG